MYDASCRQRPLLHRSTYVNMILPCAYLSSSRCKIQKMLRRVVVFHNAHSKCKNALMVTINPRIYRLAHCISTAELSLSKTCSILSTLVPSSGLWKCPFSTFWRAGIIPAWPGWTSVSAGMEPDQTWKLWPSVFEQIGVLMHSSYPNASIRKSGKSHGFTMIRWCRLYR